MGKDVCEKDLFRAWERSGSGISGSHPEIFWGIDGSPEQIKEYFDKPITEKDIELLRESRDLVLNKYNIWEVIYKIINKT